MDSIKLKVMFQPEVILFIVVALILIAVTFYQKTPNNSEPIVNNGNNTDSEQVITHPKEKYYPSQILNLTNWKLTIPTITSGDAIEIKQPKLSTYNLDPWFIVSSKKDGVRFRAPVNGTTTSGSDYPRSELREMINDGRNNASWSSGAGKHTMVLDQAITAVPITKKDVVAGQIHDDKEDVIVIRLNYPNLHIRVDGNDVYTLDSNYTLAKRFTIKFEVSENQTKVYYNNGLNPVYTLNKNYLKAYFKAGSYTQSNCEKEVDVSLCNDDNYGEVVIYDVTVSHY